MDNPLEATALLFETVGFRCQPEPGLDHEAAGAVQEWVDPFKGLEM